MKRMPNASVHFIWTIFLLSLALVGTLSVHWSAVEGLPGIISLALSLASLILAMIAIVQALISNEGLVRSVGDVGRAAENVLQVSRDLQRSASSLEENFASFGGVPDQIASIDEKLSSMANSPVAVGGGKEIVPEESRSRSGHYDVAGMVGKATVGSTMALYICLQSFKLKKPFEYNNIADQRNSSYYAGCIAIFRAMGVMNIVKPTKDEFLVKDMGPFTESMIVSLVERQKGANAIYMDKYIAIVDKYFSS